MMPAAVSAFPRPTSCRKPPRIGVIGAGMAGAACAAGLLREGFDVTVFDKSRGVGGRMATRRAQGVDVDGRPWAAEFDHGCPHFTVTRARFQAVVERAEALGHATRCTQRLYATPPAPRLRQVVVPTPNMPSFCRHLLAGVPLRLGNAVSALQRRADGWWLSLADGRIDGPFDQLMLALPAAQAAPLLAGHRDDWAETLAAARIAPCWTLMAVTDDLDWPWDAAELERGDLASVARNDRKPGRDVGPGLAQWVAHATPGWSLAHLEDDPAGVAAALCSALEKWLPGPRPIRWHHASAHRWRYARPMRPVAGGLGCWWSTRLGLGVCGDSFGDGSVEAAWCSGEELAEAVAAAVDAASRALSGNHRAAALTPLS